MKINKITFLALLSALSLALFSIELFFPSFPFCPAAKIGLANAVSLFMLVNPKHFRTHDIFAVTVTRCLLAAFITGRMMSVLFSLLGGTGAVLSMLCMRRFLNEKYVVIISVTGAIVHNLIQILVAVVIYGTMSAFYYIPSLFIAGTMSGSLIGFCVRLLNKNGFINKINRGV